MARLPGGVDQCLCCLWRERRTSGMSSSDGIAQLIGGYILQQIPDRRCWPRPPTPSLRRPEGMCSDRSGRQRDRQPVGHDWQLLGSWAIVLGMQCVSWLVAPLYSITRVTQRRWPWPTCINFSDGRLCGACLEAPSKQARAIASAPGGRGVGSRRQGWVRAMIGQSGVQSGRC